MVLRNAVIILGAFEKSTLMDRMQRKKTVLNVSIMSVIFKRFEGLNRVSRVNVIERACLTSMCSI